MISRGTPAEPIYASWRDFLARTPARELRVWCARKAKVANRPKLMSGTPELRITSEDVWMVLASARGRCHHCGSLALERRPSGPDGRPLPWDPIGRRIGSLEHIEPVIFGGANTIANLTWACLWCNTWAHQRVPGAIDHGAQQQPEAEQEPGSDMMRTPPVVGEVPAPPWLQVVAAASKPTRIGRITIVPRR